MALRGRKFQMEAWQGQRTLGSWTHLRSKKGKVASGVSEGSGKRWRQMQGGAVFRAFPRVRWEVIWGFEQRSMSLTFCLYYIIYRSMSVLHFDGRSCPADTEIGCREARVEERPVRRGFAVIVMRKMAA